jgi:hypothetical protein
MVRMVAMRNCGHGWRTAWGRVCTERLDEQDFSWVYGGGKDSGFAADLRLITNVQLLLWLWIAFCGGGMLRDAAVNGYYDGCRKDHNRFKLHETQRYV